MTIKIIGVGYGRTGTMSTQVALNILGFPCYHMIEVIKNKANRKHVDFWLNVARSLPGSQHDWQEVFANYNATIDNPGACVWQELMEAYPEAKILLTMHPIGAEEWYESTMDTIYFSEAKWQFKVIGFISPFIRKLGEMSHRLVWQRNHKGTMQDRDSAIADYHRHIEEIKTKVPPENLLIFTADQGWGPLCQFLGVDAPETEFPKVNDRTQIKRMNAGMIIAAYGILAIGVAAFVGFFRTIGWLMSQ
ncbi:MAG: hypothetical protein KJ737_17330 [Proteobacteria bacterium]|nr:hypothetical protein [Pseudomonadota bacterium]